MTLEEILHKQKVLESVLSKYKYSLFRTKINKKYIPVSVIELDKKNINEWNTLAKAVEEGCNRELELTASGGIRIKQGNWGYSFKRCYAGLELMLIFKGKCYRIQFRTNSKLDYDLNEMSGSKAFKMFRELCEKNNIDLNNYACEPGEGPKIKEEIEKPLIKLEEEQYKDLALTNCHHIDFHSSYPSGLINTHPEFRPVIEPLYESRKTNPINKAILNLTIGFMQSVGGCNAKYAKLSRDAIKDNNDRIRQLAEELKASGRIVIAYNTDGIWYRGDIFHNDMEGTTLCTWATDHKDCILRFKSAGCYEFIENGAYTPVVRGTTRLDATEPDRTKWKWGDIYKFDEVENEFHTHKNEKNIIYIEER